MELVQGFSNIETERLPSVHMGVERVTAQKQQKHH